MNKYAYVTLVTKKHYIKGARNLWLSLQRAQCKYPLIILVTENLLHDPEINIYQEFQGITIKIIPRQRFSDTSAIMVNESLGDARDTLNKLYVFELIEYDYVCFLDADILVKTKRLDNLFDRCKTNEPIYGFYFPEVIEYHQQTAKRRLIGGYCFIVKPVKNLYYQLITLSEKTQETNDEVVLSLLFPKFAENKDQHFEDYSLFYHDGWTFNYKKYWTWITIDPAWFMEFSDEEMEEFCHMLQGIGVNYHDFLYKNSLIDKDFLCEDNYINY